MSRHHGDHRQRQVDQRCNHIEQEGLFGVANGDVGFTHDVFQADKGTGADKENVICINRNEFLIGVLATALRGYIANRALNDFQQGLLNTFTGNVAGNGNIFTFLSLLVDFVDVDDAILGLTGSE